ncbi:MAG TPA: phosphomannomutase/phosphoglucomutase [bacterium]|nr:phosphomannomutase/phosphoglucomutase [bacterium]HOL34765.1 phosphomannomutase/phosphoglucomutase [bacterium]HPP08469.1 phosphomannomutase/phosphoglucomutase [bacterium]
MSIFKPCDIRGTFGIELTEQISYKIGRAIGTLSQEKRIVLGGDLRPSTQILKQALIKGLVNSGCNVIDIGIVPTPVFYFAIKHLSADGGVQITGSHNPPSDNGMKVMLGKSPITPEEIKKIQSLVESETFSTGNGKISHCNVVSDYKNYIKGLFEPGYLTIAVDAGNGCWWKIAPEVLQEMGYRVIKLFCEPDGTFPNRAPNPAIYKNLKAIQNLVKTHKVDMAVAYDGDGDRAIFIDENGNIVKTDIAIVIFIKFLLQRNKNGAVVHDIKCSQIVRDEIVKNGGIPIMEKSGHAFIKSKFLKTNAIFAGEISGHYFFKDIGGDDGLFATLMMAKIVQEKGPLSKQITEIPVYATSPDIRIPVTNPEEILNKIEKHYPAQMVNKLDGIRIQFEYGWALIRKSVTEPMITMRFEGKTPDDLKNIKSEIFSFIPESARLTEADNE